MLRSKQAGFTLTEAMVSIAVLSIGFVGMYHVLAGAERSLGKTFEIYDLAHSANSVIEDVNTDRENVTRIESMPLDQPIVIVIGEEDRARRLDRERERWREKFRKYELDLLPVKSIPMDLDESGVIDLKDSQKIVVEITGLRGTKINFERIHRRPQ
jgi:prepilin-type N-terminal cleavage/methylation domain-containing protein